jgi:hypothetical protein
VNANESINRPKTIILEALVRLEFRSVRKVDLQPPSDARERTAFSAQLGTVGSGSDYPNRCVGNLKTTDNVQHSSGGYCNISPSESQPKWIG